MREPFPDSGYGSLIASMTEPRARPARSRGSDSGHAEIILTENTRHFPDGSQAANGKLMCVLREDYFGVSPNRCRENVPVVLVVRH